MDVREPTWADVESVLDRLSEQHQAEYRKLGWPDERFFASMAAFMAQGDTKALYFDGAPQAVLSIKNTAIGPVTWLACTKEFFAKGVAPTRAARRYMQDAVKRHRQVLSIVGSDHPQAAKWMKVIGFTLVKDLGDMKIFRFT
jgi:hypothetical protein